MAKRTKLEGRTRAVGRGGEGVVETAEGIVMVPGALPGEHVELQLLPSKRGAQRGRLLRVVEASAQRIDPTCPEVSRCGGCPLMVANPNLQRDIKLGYLRDAFEGLPGADSITPEWITAGNELQYRRRARLAWHGATLGYRLPRSRRVTDIERCLVIEPSLQAAWQNVRVTLGGVLSGSGDVRLERSGARDVVVGLATNDEQSPDLFIACEALSGCDGISGVTLRTDANLAPASWGETTLHIGSGNDWLTAPSSGFAQANDAINRLLIEHVVRLAAPKELRVLELHSGVGNFTLPLAAASPSALIAVEQDADAVEACRRNIRERGLHARVTIGDANAPPKGHYDVVVLDPPRQGARALFEKSGLFPGPKRIVYVSCDTSTLARDLRIVTEAGYRIDTAIGFDMFPQTAHLESLVRLVRHRTTGIAPSSSGR